MASNLSLHFETLKPLALQYDPSSISIGENARHQTIPTIQGKTTFLASKTSYDQQINIGCYFTALLSLDEQQEFSSLVGPSISAAALLGSDIVQVFNQIKQTTAATVGLVNGFYNTVTGLMEQSPQFLTSVGNINNALGILENLREAERTGDLCRLRWDLTDQNEKYYIKSVNLNVVRLEPKKGQTLEFSLNLSLQHAGNVVIRNA